MIDEWINSMLFTCPLLPKARTRMDAMTTNRSGNEKLKGKFLIFDMWVPLCKSFFLERKQTSFLVWFDLQTIWLGGGMPFAQNAAAGRGRIIPQKKLSLQYSNLGQGHQLKTSKLLCNHRKRWQYVNPTTQNLRSNKTFFPPFLHCLARRINKFCQLEPKLKCVFILQWLTYDANGFPCKPQPPHYPHVFWPG